MKLYEGVNEEKSKLTIKGKFPSWLNGGSVYRNGPGLFHLKHQSFNHWFDGYSIIQRFNFENNDVYYQSKFVESKDYLKSTKTGKVEFLNFATNPKRNIFKNAYQLVTNQISDNPNVNIVSFQNKLIALGEITGNYEIDYETLKTIKKFNFDLENRDDPTGGDLAHPVYDIKSNQYINIGIKLGRPSSYYAYSVTKGSSSKHIIWQKKLSEPRYFHSFGVTQKYIILIEPPFTTTLKRLLTKPFIDSYKWDSSQKTRVTIIDRESGQEREVFTEPFFFFHIANSFEVNNKIVIDISTYPDSGSISDGFTINSIENNNFSFEGCSLKRMTIDLDSSEIISEILHDGVFEFPTIHYKSDSNNPNYNTIYGVTAHKDFFGILTKFSINTQSKKTWEELGCYAGEPLIVHNPQNPVEFVVLSLVYDNKNDEAFLICLDDEFKEIARAISDKPVPMSFHGSFVFN